MYPYKLSRKSSIASSLSVLFTFSAGTVCGGVCTNFNNPPSGLIFATSSQMVIMILSRKVSSTALVSDSSIYPQIAEMTALLY